MAHTARRCGALALARLQRGRGEVLAAFTSSAYLVNTAGELFAVGGPAMPAGPLNLCIGADLLATIEPGLHWRYRDRRLSIGDTALADLSQFRIWRPPSPVALDPRQLQNALATLRQDLRQTAEPSSAAVEAVLERGCSALADWLQQPRQLPPAVAAMIGCGEGLTPAGDDILCGFIVALHSWALAPAAALSNTLAAELPHRTSRISAAHLQAACSGAATELLHDLTSATRSCQRAAIAGSVAALKDYGHSSGLHAARGVAEALACIAQIESQTRSRSQLD